LQEDQRVADMAVDVLARQAGARATRTGEPFDEALKAVLETEAGRQLGELRDGSHRDERADRWQESLTRERAQERKRQRADERKRVEQAAEWEQFLQAEIERLIPCEPLPGEPPAALERLASEDRRQAEERLVALMRGGKVFYKHIDELSPEDMSARIAANRARSTWLKERGDGWLRRGDGSL